MAEYVVSFVVETIGNLLIDKAKFLWGVGSKVEDLQRELRLIQCLLRDADARREHSQTVRELVAQLQDVAYDAEDVIERYILRVALKKGQNIIQAYVCFAVKCTCVQVHVVGTEIEGLKSRISDIGRSMQNYGIQSMKEAERKQGEALMPKRSYAHFEEDIIGREDSVKVLLKELKDEKRHKVVSIWGMGGLGKTTLAKKVFAHNEVKSNFNGFAWASISQEFHVKDILMGILVKLDPNQREEAQQRGDDELLETLYNIQQEKRCIVVLDDIWKKQDWDRIQAAFPIENTRSKLLITTRNREVAEYIDPHGFLYEPQTLSYHESWELLMKRVFPIAKGLPIELSFARPGVAQGIAMGQALEGIERQSDTEGQIPVITEDMKRLGDELLKKCGGLPLAIIVLGGLLAVNEWETVYRKINLHFGDKSDVSEVLALSYDDLPWHIKPCFLHLGSFPEDAEIPATKLLHMWIAEGFVSLNAYDEKKKIQVEDVAEQYLTELVNRGIVQVRFTLNGKINTCHLHDLIRDLCISKAAQENFLTILNVQNDIETENCSSSMAIKFDPTCRIRRLSFNTFVKAKGTVTQSLKQVGRVMHHLRSFIFFAPFINNWEHFQHVFINCKFLRVLKIENLYLLKGNLPASVGDLIQLRFLSLAGSHLKSLPQSLGNLGCMEFLDLCVDAEVMITVPNVLWKMKRLRHLRLPINFFVKGKRKKLQLNTLKNMRTLKNFCPKNCDMNDLGKLSNLQKLIVTYQFDPDKLEIIPSLAKFNLKHLQSTSFRFSNGFCSSFTEDKLSVLSSYRHSCNLIMYGDVEKLPECVHLPQQLRKLVLIHSILEEDPMPILEKMQHLVVLLLVEEAFLGKEMVCSAGGFPQLKHLVLENLPNLEDWRVAEGAMPLLSQLGISECPQLKTVPEGIHIFDGSEYVDHELRKHSAAARSLPELRKILIAVGVNRAARMFIKNFQQTSKFPSSGRRGGEEQETLDEGVPTNDEVSSLEASEESSTN